jgi:acetylserotonin N-methyltransferase
MTTNHQPANTAPVTAAPADPTIGRKTERLNEMAFAYMNSSALLAAIKLGIFSAIAEGAGDVADIASKTGLQPETAERLLIVCQALQLVRVEDGRYRNLNDVERYLVKASPTYFGDYLFYMASAGLSGTGFSGGEELIGHLTGVSAGKQVKAENIYASLMSTRESARKFTEAGYNSSIALAHRLAKHFDFSRFKRWLDLAGGSGCYSIAACERNPQLHTIVMDNPFVLEVTQEFVAKHGLEKRIDTLPGDFFKTVYPRGCDLISFITPLQGYMPDKVREALRLAFEALEPGGTLLVVDYMLNDAKSGPLDPALMNLAGVISGELVGRVNSSAEFREFFASVGFTDLDTWWLMKHQLGVVSGRKPF